MVSWLDKETRKPGAGWHWNIFVGIDQLRCSREPLGGTFLGLVLVFVSWETPRMVLLSSVELFPFWMCPDARNIHRTQSGCKQEIVRFWWVGKSSKVKKKTEL